MLKRKKAAASSSFQAGKDEDNGGSMVVAVRIRPLSSKEIGCGQKICCTAVNDTTIAIKKEGNASMYLKSQQGSVNEYCFDSVFDSSSSQREVYEKTAMRFIRDVIEGYNVTVFAYGATGAGKTHTMMGNARVDDSQASSSEAGIIPNALNDVFSIISSKRAAAQPGEKWNIIVSFMEVYNEQVYDLLESTDKVLSVREDTERGVVEVAGRTKKVVQSAEDVLQLLELGNTNRKTEATMANQVSSRSHAVLQLSVEYNFRNKAGQETSVLSTLSMIDLAGSERASATNNRGSRLQEGANINKSLLALANCINALAGNTSSGRNSNVKYRDSKLTHLLKSSLQGNCKLVMIANINPSHITFEDSHNSLKYANRAKNIKVNPLIASEINKESTWVEREARLKEENAQLRARVKELESIVESLQSVNSMIPDDFCLKEQDDVIDCSMDCSIINSSAVNSSLPAISDIPPIKTTKTPQLPSGKKKTPHSERQTQREKMIADSREEFDDVAEDNCSFVSNHSNAEHDLDDIINQVNNRRKSIEIFSKKRLSGEDHHSSQSKKVKLEPMAPSLKDRIAELSKITLEQQKMFDNLLQDPNFANHLNESREQNSNKDVQVTKRTAGFQNLVSKQESKKMSDSKGAVSLDDVVIEESQSMPFIFCDEEGNGGSPDKENSKRRRRRSSLIPKKAAVTKKPLKESHQPSEQNVKNDDDRIAMKVSKNAPLTRAAKKRMSIVSADMSENQPVEPKKEKASRRGSLQPVRATRRSSISNVTTGKSLRKL